MRKSILIASVALGGALGLAAPASAQFFPYVAPPPVYAPMYGPTAGYVVADPGYAYGYGYGYGGGRASGTNHDAAFSSPWDPGFGRGRNAGGASANYGF